MTRVLDKHPDVDVNADDEPAPIKRPFYRRPYVMIIGAVALLAAIIFGLRYYLYARSHESTDDAFIDGDIVQISPKVQGHVLRIHVSDNQQVKKGDLLVEIDPADFQARLDQARAGLQEAESRQNAANQNVALTEANTRAATQQASAGVRAARAGVRGAEAQVTTAQGRLGQTRAAVRTAQENVRQAQAQVVAAQAEATRANTDLARFQMLYDRDEVSRQQLDQAVAAARTATANLEAARTRTSATEAQVAEARAAEQAAVGTVQQAQSQVGGTQAQVGEAAGRLAAANTAPQQVAVSQAQVQTTTATIEQARAAVAEAELNLSYTKIYAPEDGRVTRKTAQEGQLMQVGQPLMALVTGDIWVTANFKETQLNEIQPGQPVELTVDAYPGKTFKAHIDSIQSGSGARFSLLPPENATGNYVKVVQRVPVKIVFDEAIDPRYVLGPGISVTPEVKVK
jgi:membrane fusion protein, multidrug efflux system